MLKNSGWRPQYISIHGKIIRLQEGSIANASGKKWRKI